VSAPESRLARQMRPHLGTELWDEFVEHENHHYKAGLAARVCACASGVLRCVDTLDGAPCMHARGAVLDLRAGTGTGVGWEREVGTALERLHLDHERPLQGCMRRVTSGARQCARRRGCGTTDRTVRHCATACLAWGLARRRLRALSVRSAARR